MKLRIDPTITTVVVIGALALSTIGAYRDGHCEDKGFAGCIGVGSARLIGHLDAIQGVYHQVGESSRDVQERIDRARE